MKNSLQNNHKLKWSSFILHLSYFPRSIFNNNNNNNYPSYLYSLLPLTFPNFPARSLLHLLSSNTPPFVLFHRVSKAHRRRVGRDSSNSNNSNNSSHSRRSHSNRSRQLCRVEKVRCQKLQAEVEAEAAAPAAATATAQLRSALAAAFAFRLLWDFAQEGRVCACRKSSKLKLRKASCRIANTFVSYSYRNVRLLSSYCVTS